MSMNIGLFHTEI